MQIIHALLSIYNDAHGGGKRYPSLSGRTILDWIERGPGLVVYLDCSEAEAQAIVDDVANAEFSPRIVPTSEATDKTSEVNQIIWRTVRAERDNRLAAGPDKVSALMLESMSSGMAQAWRDYRLILLDITESATPAEAMRMLSELEVPA